MKAKAILVAVVVIIIATIISETFLLLMLNLVLAIGVVLICAGIAVFLFFIADAINGHSVMFAYGFMAFQVLLVSILMAAGIHSLWLPMDKFLVIGMFGFALSTFTGVRGHIKTTIEGLGTVLIRCMSLRKRRDGPGIKESTVINLLDQLIKGNDRGFKNIRFVSATVSSGIPFEESA